MDNLKDLGLKKTYGASFDVQLFRILQCIRTSQDDFPKELSQSLFRCCFSLEKLSSSLLLPISAQSKAFAFCRFGQDLNSHGIVMLTKACQVLVKGQLISKFPIGVIVWIKMPTKFFPGFLP